MKTSQLTDFRRMRSERSTLARQWRGLIAALIFIDALGVLGALALAYVLRIEGWLPYAGPQPNVEAYFALVATAVPLFLVCFAFVGMYRPDNLLGGIVEYKQVVKGASVGIMTLVILTTFVRAENFDVSRLWVVMSWLLAMSLVGALRFFTRRAVYALRTHRGWLTSRVLIIGANDQGVAIAEQWLRTPASGMHVVGFLDDFKTIGTTITGRAKVIGRPSALDQISREHNADEIVVVSSAVAWETFGEVVTSSSANKDYTLRLSPGFYDLLTTGVAVTNKTFVPLLTINENRIVGVDAVFKLVLDYGLAVPMAVLTLPVQIALALVLKLRHPAAPVLTRTPVLGRGGKPFTMLCFNSAPGRAGQRASRRLERLMRYTGMHKLPQLWNVLAGQMSLVGPSPRAAVNEVTDMHTAHNLLAVKPGIIGPWVRQDHLRSPDVATDELNYVRNWQIWLDLPLLFQAVGMFFSRLVRGIVRKPLTSPDQTWSPRVRTLGEDALS